MRITTKSSVEELQLKKEWEDIERDWRQQEEELNFEMQMVMEKLKQLKKTGVSMKVLLEKYCTTNKYCTPNPSKTSRINEWPSPKLVQEMQQFLGQAN